MAEQQTISPRVGHVTVALLLMLHILLFSRSVFLHFPNIDEAAHVVAGVSHWQLGTFDLFNANPPLVRMVGTLPVFLVGGRGDFRGYRDSVRERPEFTFARNLYGREGPKWVRYTFLARFGCLPFTILGAIVSYRWAGALWGVGAGVIAAALWCLDPMILANAQTVNPDLGAAAVGLSAGYAFWLWLRDPTWQRALACGILLGFAQLTKLTWLILFGLWPMMFLFYHARSLAKREMAVLQPILQLSAILASGLFVLNVGYGFEGTLRPLGAYTFVSQTFSGQPAGGIAGNRFADTPLAYVPVPLPSNHVQGIDCVDYEFERNYPSYLRGTWKDGGWWYYYLYAAAIKIPLGFWLLLAVAAVIPIADTRYRIPFRDAMALLLPGIAIFAIVSSQTGFNHHFRYVLPGVPFFFVFASRLGQAFDLKQRWLSTVTFGCICWGALSGFYVYPHSVSYFNELIGGPSKGHLHLLNSNIDWGQDLLFLKTWMDQHPHARPMGILASHQLRPGSAGIRDYFEPNAWPPEEPGVREYHQLERPAIGPEPGWFAISVNFLQGYVRAEQAAKFGFHTPNAPKFTYFQRFTPVDRIGYSMYVYHITLDECNRVRGELRLPPIEPDEADDGQQASATDGDHVPTQESKP